MGSFRVYFVLAVIGIVAAGSSATISELKEKSRIVDEDAGLNITQLIEKYGYRGEVHHVVTDDGYELEMHRITGPNGNSSAGSNSSNGKPPVLVMHSLLGSSDDWIITGPQKALGYILADRGYDVWLGNMRGNKFSHKHIKIDPSKKAFWNFSWHESGINDLPSMIDYVLKTSDNTQLAYIGHGEGTTAFWVMAAERPAYQDKIKAMFAIAPVAYMEHTKSPFYRAVAKFGWALEKLARLLGQYEFNPSNELISEVAEIVCDEEYESQLICSKIMFLIGGASYNHINMTMLPTILAHAPAGGSVKQILHFLQLIKSHKFRQYDYGPLGNLRKYKKIVPPTYELSKILVPVYLHFSAGDAFTDTRDVAHLYAELGHTIGQYKVADRKFAHLDFLWGKNANTLVYEKIISQMAQAN